MEHMSIVFLMDNEYRMFHTGDSIWHEAVS
jgi:hypothetical protein